MNLAASFEYALRSHGNSPAILPWRQPEERDAFFIEQTQGDTAVQEGKDTSPSSISHAELDVQTTHLAYKLALLGVKAGDVVATTVDAEALVFVYLALLKVGAVFCPLYASDKTLEEKAFEVRAVLGIYAFEDPPVHLTQDKTRQYDGQSNESLTQWIPFEELMAASNPPNDNIVLEGCTVNPQSPVHIIFTSGSSSGRGKAVVCDHFGSLYSHAHRNNILKLDKHNDVVGCSLFGIWDVAAALLVGAPVVMIPYEITQSPAQLAKVIERSGITRIMLTPSLASQVCPLTCNSALREVTLCGEQVNASLVNTILQSLGSRGRVLNLYSISEAHDVALGCWDANTELYDDQPLPLQLFPHVNVQIDNEEIIILGEHVAKGYLSESDTLAHSNIQVGLSGSSSAFGIDHSGQRRYKTGDKGYLTEEGALVVEGRLKDAREVKVRGYRVSLPDYETQLVDVLNLHSCAVLFDQDKNALYAFIVPEHAAKCNKSFELTALECLKREKITPLPSCLVSLAALPCKPGSGKLDTPVLQSILYNRIQSKGDEQVLSNIEKQVVSTIAKVLNWDDESASLDSCTDFFTIGGSSLTYFALLQNLEHIFKVPIPAEEVLTLSRVKELASYIEVKTTLKASSGHTPQSASQDQDEKKKEVDDRLRSEMIQRLLKDTMLGDNINFPGPSSTQSRVALVTGACGFIGAATVAKLLESGWDNVYCLSRRRIESSSELWAILEKKLEKPHPQVKHRILHEGAAIPVQAPLSQLSNIALSWQSIGIDCIVHLAARIDTCASYNALADTNVMGTTHVLELASSLSPHPRIVIMSSSAALPPRGSVYEKNLGEGDMWPASLLDKEATVGSICTRDLYHGTYEGYSQTKWVCEQLAAQSLLRGAACHVVRASQVTPCSREHAIRLAQLSENSDSVHASLLCDLLAASSYAPELPSSAAISFAPVSKVAAVIVAAANSSMKYNEDSKVVSHAVLAPVPLDTLLARLGPRPRLSPHEWLCDALDKLFLNDKETYGEAKSRLAIEEGASTTREYCKVKGGSHGTSPKEDPDHANLSSSRFANSLARLPLGAEGLLGAAERPLSSDASGGLEHLLALCGSDVT